MNTFANGRDDFGRNGLPSAPTSIERTSGISQASSARSKKCIPKEETLIVGGASVGSNEGDETSTIAADDEDGGDNDADPDWRSRRKTSRTQIEPVLLAFAPLSHYIGFGRSRIYQLISERKFPSPIKVGKSSRWVRAEIDQWLAQQIAARPQSSRKGAI